MLLATAAVVHLEGAALAAAERDALAAVLEHERAEHARSDRLLADAPPLSSLVPSIFGEAEAEAEPPPADNSSGRPTPEWASGLGLPEYLFDTPPTVGDGELRHLPASPSERAPLLPTLYLPGFPKAATTWLSNCVQYAFSPVNICGRRAEKWAACTRRYALAPLFTDARAQPSAWKELFFFGGRPPAHPLAYRPDLLELHGPDPTGGPLRNLSLLWPWERQLLGPRRGSASGAELMGRLRAMCAQSVPPQSCLSGGGGDACRAAPRCSVLGTAACEGANWRGVCRGLGAARPQPQLGCTHPACARVAEASAAESGQFSLNCVWSPRLKAVSGRSDAYCAHSLLPWAARGELNASVMDFTPNYICDADAMARIHDSAAERPEAVKFIVVVRDPVARAFSEWSMFALGWNWDPVKNFSAAMAYKLQALQRCNRSLYLNVSRLRQLPTTELAAYLRKCFDYGRATMYATSSMYSACLLHALRYFKREQFLVLRYEDLMAMDAAATLRLLSRFTGLHLDDSTAAKARGKCQPARLRAGKQGKADAPPNAYSSSSPHAAEMLAEAAPQLEAVFAPYNALLSRAAAPALETRCPHDYSSIWSLTRRCCASCCTLASRGLRATTARLHNVPPRA